MNDEAEQIARHKVGPDGEDTSGWFCQQGGFWGTVNQLLLCARCGGRGEIKRHDEPRHYRDICKPTLHMICDACFDELPE